MFSLQTIFGSGKQFYTLLDAAAAAAVESGQALVEFVNTTPPLQRLDGVRLARKHARDASDGLSQALVDSFITPFEREDIEALRLALYKIPKQVERFADRYTYAAERLQRVDFRPRAALLDQAARVVAEMVRALPKARVEPIKLLNERLSLLETEADHLLLDFYRETYSGRMDVAEIFLLKEFFEIFEKAIDRCADAGMLVYQIALKGG